MKNIFAIISVLVSFSGQANMETFYSTCSNRACFEPEISFFFSSEGANKGMASYGRIEDYKSKVSYRDQGKTVVFEYATDYGSVERAVISESGAGEMYTFEEDEGKFVKACDMICKKDPDFNFLSLYL